MIPRGPNLVFGIMVVDNGRQGNSLRRKSSHPLAHKATCILCSVNLGKKWVAKEKDGNS